MTYLFIHWWLFPDQCLSDRQREAWSVEIAMINHLIEIDPALTNAAGKKKVILFSERLFFNAYRGLQALSGISGLDDMEKNWIIV